MFHDHTYTIRFLTSIIKKTYKISVAYGLLFSCIYVYLCICIYIHKWCMQYAHVKLWDMIFCNFYECVEYYVCLYFYQLDIATHHIPGLLLFSYMKLKIFASKLCHSAVLIEAVLLFLKHVKNDFQYDVSIDYNLWHQLLMIFYQLLKDIMSTFRFLTQLATVKYVLSWYNIQSEYIVSHQLNEKAAYSLLLDSLLSGRPIIVCCLTILYFKHNGVLLLK